MTNETTASQPKSIGDDAQFKKLATTWFIRNNKADHEAMIEYLDSKLRALAAQASATIQAAPDLSSLRVHTGRDLQGAWLADQDKFVKLSDVEALLAATIQEPVMVAEPMGKRPISKEWSLKAAQAEQDSGVAGIGAGAAPMVADPAGVVLSDSTIIGIAAKSGVFATIPQVLEFGRDIIAAATVKAAPMVADPTGVTPEMIQWRNIQKTVDAVADFCFDSKDHPVYGSSHRAVTTCLTAMDGVQVTLEPLAATVKAVPSEALAAIHGLIAVAGAAYHLMDNTEETGPVGASVFKHQEDDNAYLNEALDQLDALPDDQPGYVMGPCAKAEWALRHILAAPLADKTGGGE